MKPKHKAGLLAVAGVVLACLWGVLRAPADAAAALRAQTFTATDGSPQTLARWHGRPLLVNFWATWCAPCREEMPVLDRLAQRAGAPQVIGIAWDSPRNMAVFMDTTPVGYPVLSGGGEIGGLMRALGNASGGLPFSVLLDAQGRLRGAHTGVFDAQLLDAWVAEHSGANGSKMRGIMDNLLPSAANSRP